MKTMKYYLSNGFKLGVLYTTVLFGLVVFEEIDKGRSHQLLPSEMFDHIAIGLAISILAFSYLSFLYKAHTKMLNLGLKRLIVVVFTVLSPISIYVGYSIGGINRLSQHFLICSMAIAFSYAVLLNVDVSIKWVADGFNK